MLIGTGGSGRQSLARLAAYIASMTVFCIEIQRTIVCWNSMKISRSYICSVVVRIRRLSFSSMTPKSRRKASERISITSTLPALSYLFSKDEYSNIYDSVRKAVVSLGQEETRVNMWKFFINRVRNNLHVILAMSPIGDTLRNRCRMYPGFINNTTIDTFHT